MGDLEQRISHRKHFWHRCNRLRYRSIWVNSAILRRELWRKVSSQDGYCFHFRDQSTKCRSQTISPKCRSQTMSTTRAKIRESPKHEALDHWHDEHICATVNRREFLPCRKYLGQDPALVGRICHIWSRFERIHGRWSNLKRSFFDPDHPSLR